jgi:hypothetical protein
MIDQAHARSVVEQLLNEEQFAHVELSILDEFTREYPYGWVFFYQAKRFVETGNPRHMVGGNAPILIHRRTGTPHILGTGARLEQYLEPYERAWYDTPPQVVETQQDRD